MSKQENKVKRFVNKIKNIINKIISFLEALRNKNNKIFDICFRIFQITLLFIEAFLPHFIDSTSSLSIFISLFCVLLLLVQWAALKTKYEQKNKEDSDIFFQLYDEDTSKKKKTASETLQKERAASSEKIDLSQNMIDFSHLVSHTIKQLSMEIKVSPRSIADDRVSGFLYKSANSIEDLLSRYYGKDVRVSIKLSIDDNTIKTYARGQKNIQSRKGLLAVKQLDEPVSVEQNYAYDAIINQDLPFFAEGDLNNMQNKTKIDDTFYCEHSGNKKGIFSSTFIMSIRVPYFSELPEEETKSSKYKMYGLICIDCKDKTDEWSWSTSKFKNTTSYHVVADYADSVALLLYDYKGKNYGKN